jgi:hypothetical protein
VILQAITTSQQEVRREATPIQAKQRRLVYGRRAGLRSPRCSDRDKLGLSLSGAIKNEKVARFKKIREELEKTRRPGDIARLLNQNLEFTQADLSAATGAHERTVAGWLGKEAQAPGNNQHKNRLLQLKALVSLILEDGTIAEELVDWFRDPNRNLGYRKPFELIAEGRWQRAGISLCEETGIPKAVWPEAFRREAVPGRKKLPSDQSSSIPS